MDIRTGSDSSAVEQLLRSHLDWWALAGVDEAVLEAPTAPLARRAADVPDVQDAAPGLPQPAALAPAFADDPERFLDGLRTGSEVYRTPAERGPLVPPQIAVDAPILVLTDAPTDEDAASGTLFSGEAGQFLDALVRAVSLDRARISMASLFLCPVDPAHVTESITDQATRRLRHIISIARARGVLMLGDRTSRALSGTDDAAQRESLRFINYPNATVPVILAPSIAILMRRGDRKAALWRDLRRLGTDQQQHAGD